VHTAEELGYTHLRLLDHVLGADPQFHPEVPVFYYTYESVTHEPFTLMAYLAALTTRIELTTAIIILPQRQTALVAKQAAEVDVLSGGRLRLGIGVGWNPVEYEALGEDFQTRGHRSEEQIEVLRLLWTQEVVTYSGRWHQISHAGLNPRPIQRPIPIWIGSGRPDAAPPHGCAALRVWRRVVSPL
jgi:probable F420-dependent oxidoreductase